MEILFFKGKNEVHRQTTLIIHQVGSLKYIKIIKNTSQNQGHTYILFIVLSLHYCKH